jgi:molybdenum cofactor cytidylyltransferase
MLDEGVQPALPGSTGAKLVSAVVLAAGESRRMGQPKMVLPWGELTVIGHVVHTLASAGLREVVVVSGGHRQGLEDALRGLSISVPLRLVHNPDYVSGEMLSSLKTGIAAMSARVQGILVALGDQPQIQVEIVRKVCHAFETGDFSLVVPSFQMRRGHPWIIDRGLWPVVVNMRPPVTLRDFLRHHVHLIHHVVVDNRSILQDLDTPDQYREALSGLAKS